MTRRRLPRRRTWPWVAAAVFVSMVAFVAYEDAHIGDSIPGDSKTGSAFALPTVDPLPDWSPSSAPPKSAPTPTTTPTPRPTRSPATTSSPPRRSTTRGGTPKAAAPSTPKTSTHAAPAPTAATVRPTPTPTTKPSVQPTPSPTASSSGVTWYTSATAVAAAQRMAASTTVGDSACSAASVGDFDPALIPAGATRVGVGESGGYWCLQFN